MPEDEDPGMGQEHEAWLESRLGPKIDRALELLGGTEALQRKETRVFPRRAARGDPDAPPYAVAVRFGFVRRHLFELELELPLTAFARLTAEDLAGLGVQPIYGFTRAFGATCFPSSASQDPLTQ